MGWVLFGGALAIFWTQRQHWLDQLYPSPAEWQWLTRWYWRNAKHDEATEGNGRGLTDWGSVGTHYRAVIGLLEDFKFIIHRPSGIIQQTDYDRTIPGLDEAEMRTMPERHAVGQLWPSRIGCDITMKSEQWRRGYYEAMMGMAKAAEMREGWMMHSKTKRIFPPEHVKSPDNPYPKPLPPGTPLEIPDVSECWPALEDPGFHYKRLLTTKGFNRKQRLDAGIAYAIWLEHAGQHDLAASMHKWTLSLALEGLGENASEIVDKDTGIIRATAPFVTPNVLETTTALAGHHARTDNISAALSIYLSVLRARRSAPQAPPSRQYPPRKPDLSLTSGDSIIRYLKTMPWDAEFPPPPPNGDQVFERNKGVECEEAALMAYVGEILFARVGRKREGLAWTQDATSLAERAHGDSKLDLQAKKACEQCVHTGLGNWHRMVGQLAREKSEALEGEGREQSQGWYGIKGHGSGARGEERKFLLEEQDWAAEEKKVQRRLGDFEEKLLTRQLNAMISGTSDWFVI